MSVKKYSLLTILSYVCAYFSPAILSLMIDISLADTIVYPLCAIALIFLYSKQTDPISYELEKKKWWSTGLIGFCGIFGVLTIQLIVNLVEQMFRQDIFSENTNYLSNMIIEHPVTIVIIVIVSPIMEEFVFRRAIPGLLELKMNSWLAICISSFMFALMHFDGHLLNYFLMGFFFSCLYRYTGRIWTSMIAHIGMNGVIFIVRMIAYYTMMKH